MTRLATSPAPFITQFAALPWRRKGEALEVLLITSRTNRRWMIPKGWQIEGLSEADSVQQEAFEEAGVLGRVASRPLGSYRYIKGLTTGDTTPSQAIIYGLEVLEILYEWPECRQRDRQWYDPTEAAKVVGEADLARFLTQWAKFPVLP